MLDAGASNLIAAKADKRPQIRRAPALLRDRFVFVVDCDAAERKRLHLRGRALPEEPPMAPAALDALRDVVAFALIFLAVYLANILSTDSVPAGTGRLERCTAPERGKASAGSRSEGPFIFTLWIQ